MAVYFSIILVVITVLTGIVWFANKFYLAPQRQLKVKEAQATAKELHAAELTPEALATLNEPSPLVDTAVQIFPVIAFVLILRSFLYEPFQIPSGSMMPTLLDGDFILVNKFNYGLKDPVARVKFIENGLPERGDVAVFKYPEDPRIDYIKRVIGLPGDRIIYRNKSLYIKAACQETDVKCPDFVQVPQKLLGNYEGPDSKSGMKEFQSDMLNKSHHVLNDIHSPTRTAMYFQQAGTAADEFLVPANHYFVMGDNRDNSLDGRFWGFVPEENLVGEAVAIWMSFDFERGDDSFLPNWVPTAIRFSRIGAIN
ncbi:signal peptidase I [Colwellia sp. E2M01]|uniref:signal peptidase I n=1 Tax=Colwellia sp. E2M01 TaxID=2841561 RepID=UPI001C08E6BD|nr:signal peptidase I [Colwellia sp. E2M01]MBU2869613.1 signal peptidase I [Colwellia sp. E2M01]